MPLLFLNQWFSNEVIKALSWMLIHSLWQGLLAAIIAGVIIISTKRSSASLRYNLLSLVFVAFLITAVATFFLQLQSPDVSGGVVDNTSLAIVQTTNVPSSFSAEPEVESNFFTAFAAYFDKHAPLVVLVWFLFFAVQTVKLFAGLHYIHRIRNQKVTVPEIEWKKRLRTMSQSLGINKPILFFQSEMIKMPVVLGFFKPTILVPLGLFSNLPPEQVETILLHELAHIRRKDYLVNLLQSFAEAVFFFNPAVTWVSSLIREEREACCDDIVVANTLNKGSYLEALVSFNEHALKSNGYALALSGKKSFLFNRVKRMITYENKKLNIMEKLFLLSGLVVFSAFSILTKQEKDVIATQPLLMNTTPIIQPEDRVKPVVSLETKAIKPVAMVTKTKAIQPTVVLDTVPKGKLSTLSSMSTHINDDGSKRTQEIKIKGEDGKNYHLKKVDNKITDFYVNDVRISESEMAAYQPVIEEIERMQKENHERSQKLREESKVRREMHEKARKEHALKIEKHREKLKDDRRLVEQKRMEKDEKNRTLFEENSKLMDKNRKAMEKYRSNKPEESQRNRISQARKPNVITRSGNGEVVSILNDLVREDVIEDRENVAFSLDNKKLVVNGKMQPAEVHQKLKEKYLNKDGDSIEYSKNGNTTRTSITKN